MTSRVATYRMKINARDSFECYFLLCDWSIPLWLRNILHSSWYLLSFTWPLSRERQWVRVYVCVCVCVWKPADWPVMFRSEQHVLTLAVDSPSFHYTTAHSGLSDCMCVLLWKHYYQSHVCRHTHTQNDRCVLPWKEVSGISRMLQTECRLPQRGWEYGWERLQVGSLWALWICPPTPARQAPFSGSHASTMTP